MVKISDSHYIGDELELFQHAQKWKRYWYDSVKKFIGESILEVGAGIGVNTAMIIKSNNSVRNIVAIEPDTRLSEQILNNLTVGSEKVRVVHGLLENLDPTEQFDTIIYIDVIEHIKNDKEELFNAANHLKVNGHLIVLAPAYNFLFSPFDQAIGHFRRYTKAKLRDAIPENLEPCQLFYIDAIGFFASLMNKYFLKQSYPSLHQVLFWDKRIIPLSRIADKLFFHSFGKSLIGIWKKNSSSS